MSREEAAVKIQSTVRGRAARKRTKMLKTESQSEAGSTEGVTSGYPGGVRLGVVGRVAAAASRSFWKGI